MAVMSDVAMDIHSCTTFCETMFSVLLGAHTQTHSHEIAGSQLILCLTFEELQNCSPKKMKHFTFLLALYKGSSFYPSPVLAIISLSFVVLGIELRTLCLLGKYSFIFVIVIQVFMKWYFFVVL
jgi:hypothetical protein